MLKSFNKSSLDILTKVAKHPYTHTLGLTATTVGGLGYFGYGAVALNALDSTFTPWVGSLVENTAAQVISLIVEAGAAVSALKSTLWVANRVSKTSALEKENADLRLGDTVLQLANANKETDLNTREKGLKERELALEKNQAWLAKKESAYKGQVTKLSKAKEALKAAQAKFTQAKKENNKKAHDTAKTQQSKQNELDAREVKLEAWKVKLETWEAALSKAAERLEEDENLSSGEDQDLSSSDCSENSQHVQERLPLPTDEHAIKVGAPLLHAFSRDHQNTSQLFADESIHSSDEETHNRNRTPSPQRTTH